MGEIHRIDRKLIKKCHVFDLYEDTMETDDGRIAYWDCLHHNGAAAIVPVTGDGKILMVKQYRNAVNRETLEIPAGKKDTPEEPGLTCAMRELEEETGYRSEHFEPLITLVTAIAYCDEIIDIYTATDLIPSAQKLDEDEFINVVACDPKELKEKILTGEIQDSKTVAALSAYMIKYDVR